MVVGTRSVYVCLRVQCVGALSLNRAVLLLVMKCYICSFSHVATKGDDYEPGPFIVTIPAGETSASFNIPIVDDDLIEEIESFNVTIDLSSLSERLLLLSNCTLIVTIINDDGKLLATYILIDNVAMCNLQCSL